MTVLAVPMLQDYAYIAHRMRPDEIEQFCAFVGWDEYLPDVAARAWANTPGVQYALLDEKKKPLVIFGFEPLRRGVLSGWMVGTLEAWERHWFAITRRTRKVMAAHLDGDTHRIELHSLASRTKAHDWYVDGLGMRLEGRQTAAAANGQDAVTHVLTRATP